MNDNIVLHLESIVKTFPGVKALDGSSWMYTGERYMPCAEKTAQENRP